MFSFFREVCSVENMFYYFVPGYIFFYLSLFSWVLRRSYEIAQIPPSVRRLVCAEIPRDSFTHQTRLRIDSFTHENRLRRESFTSAEIESFVELGQELIFSAKTADS